MSDWGQYGNSDLHQRYKKKVPSRSRRRCKCGCKTRATFVGMCNGLGMTSGCEMYIHRWVKKGYTKR